MAENRIVYRSDRFWHQRHRRNSAYGAEQSLTVITFKKTHPQVIEPLSSVSRPGTTSDVIILYNLFRKKTGTAYAKSAGKTMISNVMRLTTRFQAIFCRSVAFDPAVILPAMSIPVVFSIPSSPGDHSLPSPTARD